LYFNQKPSPTTSEQAKQLAAVLQFKEKIQEGQEGLYIPYSTLQEFTEKVYDHLHSFILKYKREKEPNVNQPLSIYDLEVGLILLFTLTNGFNLATHL
jgi:hypothetical protein